jgi:hypothetical protein
MPTHGYTISDRTSTLYRFDIPAQSTAACPNVKKIPGAVRPPAPRSTNFTGLTTVKGQVIAIAENGGFYKGLNSPVTLFKNTGTQLVGLGYNPQNDTLYSFRQSQDDTTGTQGRQLVKINLSSGGTTRIGGIQAQAVDGLTINANGKAYASDGLVSNALYSVNLNTGQLSLVGSFQLTLGQHTGLEFDPTTANALYLLAETGKLYRVNVTSGRLTPHCDTRLQSKAGETSAKFEGLTIVNTNPGGNQPISTLFLWSPINVLIAVSSLSVFILRAIKRPI